MTAYGPESDDGDWVDSDRCSVERRLIVPVDVLQNSQNVVAGKVVDTRCALATES